MLFARLGHEFLMAHAHDLALNHFHPFASADLTLMALELSGFFAGGPIAALRTDDHLNPDWTKLAFSELWRLTVCHFLPPFFSWANRVCARLKASSEMELTGAGLTCPSNFIFDFGGNAPRFLRAVKLAA